MILDPDILISFDRKSWFSGKPPMLAINGLQVYDRGIFSICRRISMPFQAIPHLVTLRQVWVKTKPLHSSSVNELAVTDFHPHQPMSMGQKFISPPKNWMVSDPNTDQFIKLVGPNRYWADIGWVLQCLVFLGYNIWIAIQLQLHLHLYLQIYSFTRQH